MRKNDGEKKDLQKRSPNTKLNKDNYIQINSIKDKRL